MLRTDASRIIDAIPQHRGPWTVQLPHPLLGRPLDEQISDVEADAHADRLAPDGWTRLGQSVQGRDADGNRVVVVTYSRIVAPNMGETWQLQSLPTIVTRAAG